MRAIIIAILICLGAWIASPGPALCSSAWCPTFQCYGASACGPGCFCLIGPGDVSGHCFSAN